MCAFSGRILANLCESFLDLCADYTCKFYKMCSTLKSSVKWVAKLSKTNLISSHSSWDLNSCRYLHSKKVAHLCFTCTYSRQPLFFSLDSHCIQSQACQLGKPKKEENYSLMSTSGPPPPPPPPNPPPTPTHAFLKARVSTHNYQ